MIWIKKKSKKILDRKIALKQMVKLFFLLFWKFDITLHFLLILIYL